MTTTWTVPGIQGLLVLVPVTVCATISYFDLPPCNDRKTPHQTLGPCQYDSDCMENAYCWGQQGCKCKREYVVYRNRTNFQCLKVATSMGDPCTADVQCQVAFTPLAECRDDTCQCSWGSRFENGRCYQSVGLGEMCQTHHNCHIKESYCVKGYCECTLQHHPSTDMTQCLRNKHLNETCLSNDECVDENSSCREVCRCNVDHVQSKDGRKCLKAANSIEEPCEEGSQCTEFLKGAECRNGACLCREKYHQRGSMCYKNVALGQRCDTHLKCVTDKFLDSKQVDVVNVDCIQDVCTCAEGYTLGEDLSYCIPFSDSGSMRGQSSSCLLILAILAKGLIRYT
ncbi:prion-like-(Q/N-rich) domain-bearing protein 25 isoform X2 [Prorops nasuta]|uniref:prion-like-(Q/N-rich) domain-bearing protein 25 isoform X2 n=1 Tax=Prorops nasuta TaxID=863751 RepID=UPI0034CEAFC6